jgi:hypothetical protein
MGDDVTTTTKASFCELQAGSAKCEIEIPCGPFLVRVGHCVRLRARAARGPIPQPGHISKIILHVAKRGGVLVFCLIVIVIAPGFPKIWVWVWPFAF